MEGFSRPRCTWSLAGTPSSWAISNPPRSPKSKEPDESTRLQHHGFVLSEQESEAAAVRALVFHGALDDLERAGAHRAWFRAVVGFSRGGAGDGDRDAVSAGVGGCARQKPRASLHGGLRGAREFSAGGNHPRLRVRHADLS